MIPRPEGYREPTDEEMKCQPEGTLVYSDKDGWVSSCYVGGKGYFPKDGYAVPIIPYRICPKVEIKCADPSCKNGCTLPDAPTDPKGEAGKLKCPLWLIPPYPMEEAAWVHGLGAEKYGPWSWRDTKVAASVYISAILRHLNAWRSGEDLDPESGRSHLAHIIAGCNIVMDAEKHGNLVDDRRKS